MSKIDQKQSEAFLHDLADASGDVISPYFRSAGLVNDKQTGGGFDPVTQADRGAERVIRNMIAARFPDDGVIGEEFPDTNTSASRCWIVDPIDGTRAFIMGLPVWGTLIGLIQDGVPIAGMMNQPYARERFWGDGRSAQYRTPSGAGSLKTRPCENLSSAVLASTTPDIFALGFESESFERISRAARMRRFGGDCYAYCLLAMGLVDVVMEASLKPFDIIPLIPIIEGAGGVVTGWDGAPASVSSRIIACGDARVHAEILSILAA